MDRRRLTEAASHSGGVIATARRIIDIDLSAYFDNVQHSLLFEKIAQRIKAGEVMHLLKMIVKATGKKGVPQGGVISPLLSNLYLNQVDRMLEKAIATTLTRKIHPRSIRTFCG
jgi:RNA-directed DNA polymerase